MTHSHFHPVYRPDIDGLRAIAVLAVVSFHAFPNFLAGGFIGVDIFFVISGYLISLIIMKDMQRDTFSYSDFYARRIKRIFPALICVLVCTLAAGWFILMADGYARLGRHVSAGAGFFSNVVLWQESGYFDTGTRFKPLLHLWSLAVEEQFYMLWPILMLVALRFRSALAAILLIVCVSYALSVVTSGNHPAAAYYLPFTRMWELAAGALVAWLCMRKPQISVGKENALSCMGVAFIAAGLALTRSDDVFPGWIAVLPVAGSALLILAGPAAFFNRHVLSWRGLVAIGLISYPLYLWHWPLLSFGHLIDGDDKLPRLVRIGIVIASFVLAWATYRWVEKPIRAGQVKHATALLSACMVVLFCVGFLIVAQKGFQSRAVNTLPANVFLSQYQGHLLDTLDAYYREECNFYDTRKRRQRNTIAAECLEKGVRGTVFLWGDSHAQALSYGIRKVLPAGVSLAQIATSGCRPALRPVPRNGADIKACTYANDFALKAIAKLKPQVVIVAQAVHHADTDWDEMAKAVATHGARLLVIGPVPRWTRSLPEIYAQGYLGQKVAYLKDELEPDVFQTDRAMQARYPLSYSSIGGVSYLSVVAKLCKDQGCPVYLETDELLKLSAVDYGHLTPAGSLLAARKVIAPYVQRAYAR